MKQYCRVPIPDGLWSGMENNDDLTAEETQLGLKHIFRVGVAGQAMVTLTEGVLLVGLADALDAPLFLIGLLAAIPPLTQLVQIPSTYLIEKYRSRKKITLLAYTGTRVCLILVALVPLLFSPALALIFLLIFILFRGIFAGLGAAAWNSIVHDLVPRDKLGEFFSRRWTYSIAISIVLSLLAGFLLRGWSGWFPDRELQVYSIIFFLGFLAGTIGLYSMSKTPEVPMPPVQEKTKFLKVFKRPFKDPNFRRLIAFLGSWNFTLFLASPFFTIYLLRRLEFGMSFVITMTVLSQVVNLVFMRVWGNFSDRYSNKSVLGISGPLFLIAIILWTFTGTPGRYVLTIPLLIVIYILLGVAMSGVTLATGNISLKLAPKREGTSYLAVNNLVSSLAMGTGPILGGVISNLLAEQRLSFTFSWTGPLGDFGIEALSFQGIDFTFFVSFLIGLYSIHRLALVIEEGEVRKDVVFRQLMLEIKRPLLNFTKVGGFREIVEFPFSLIAEKREKNRQKRNE